MSIKFCSDAFFFQAWGSLTSLKSQTLDPKPKVPPGGLVLRILTPWKNPFTSVGFEPANLGSRGEHVTPRPPRSTTTMIYKAKFIGLLIFIKFTYTLIDITTQIYKTKFIPLLISLNLPTLLLILNPKYTKLNFFVC